MKEVTDPDLLRQLDSNRYVDVNAGLDDRIRLVQGELEQFKDDPKTVASLTRELGRLQKQSGSAPKPPVPTIPLEPQEITDPELLKKLNAPAAAPPVSDAELYDPRKGMGVGEKILVGAGYATDRALRGISGAVKSGVKALGYKVEDDIEKEAEENKNEAMYKKHHPGGWAKTGEVAADVAMSALPVAKAGGVLTKTLSKLPASGVLGNVAANAGWSALVAPEDRGKAALGGGLGAAAGRYLGHVGTKGSPLGVTPGPQARWLQSQGVTPTLGQTMAEKPGILPKAISYIEEKAQSSPILGLSVEKARQRARDQAIGSGINPHYTGILEDVSQRSPLADAMARKIFSGTAAATAILTGNIDKIVIPYLAGKGYSTQIVQKWLSGQLKPAQASQIEKLAKEALTQGGRAVGD